MLVRREPCFPCVHAETRAFPQPAAKSILCIYYCTVSRQILGGTRPHVNTTRPGAGGRGPEPLPPTHPRPQATISLWVGQNTLARPLARPKGRIHPPRSAFPPLFVFVFLSCAAFLAFKIIFPGGDRLYYI